MYEKNNVNENSIIKIKKYPTSSNINPINNNKNFNLKTNNYLN